MNFTTRLRWSFIYWFLEPRQDPSHGRHTEACGACPAGQLSRRHGPLSCRHGPLSRHHGPLSRRQASQPRRRDQEPPHEQVRGPPTGRPWRPRAGHGQASGGLLSWESGVSGPASRSSQTPMVAAGEEERSGHQQSAGIDRQTDRERVVVCVCEGKMAVFKSDENRAKILTWFYFQIKEEDELPKGVCAMCQGGSCRG